VNRRNVIFVVVALLGIVLDQVTKAWIIRNVPVGAEGLQLIPGFLSIVHARNPGAAFGVLGGFAYRHQLFLVFTAVAVVVILDLARKLPPTSRLMSTSLGLIFAGAVGNVIDRLRFHYVVDFIRVYTEQPDLKAFLVRQVGTNEWPSFNVADSALVVGVALFVIHHLVYERRGAAAAGATTGAATPEPVPPTPPTGASSLTPVTPPTVTRRETLVPLPEEAPTDPGRAGS
jgi:signal peptidase II